jgi:hypothetical protein
MYNAPREREVEMERNIGMFGRLVRILLGMAVIFFAIKMARDNGNTSKKFIVVMVTLGFLGIIQGYNGVCVAKKLGLPIPF